MLWRNYSAHRTAFCSTKPQANADPPPSGSTRAFNPSASIAPNIRRIERLCHKRNHKKSRQRHSPAA